MQIAERQSLHTSLRPAISTQGFLDAMDGVTYLVSLSGIITAVGRPAWTRQANAGGGKSCDGVIGTELIAMIGGAEVKHAYKLMHQKLCTGGLPQIVFEYRCDAPETERLARMSISALQGDTGIAAMMYQSQILREVERVSMSLFEADNYRKPYDDDALVSMCSYCHDIAWPIGAKKLQREWIKPIDYYARGGGTDVVVSHGICPNCFVTVVRPNI